MDCKKCPITTSGKKEELAEICSQCGQYGASGAILSYGPATGDSASGLSLLLSICPKCGGARSHNYALSTATCLDCGATYPIFGFEEAKETIIKDKGRKDDNGKPRWDLLPWKQIKHVIEVLTFGASKYADNNWQKVEAPRERYFAAAQRHITDWKIGEKNDPESGLPHLAHAVCCILFMMWFDE